MLMRLSALKQLCGMNGPKKELVRRARDTFPVKKSLWSTAPKDNRLYFSIQHICLLITDEQKVHPKDHMTQILTDKMCHKHVASQI